MLCTLYVHVRLCSRFLLVLREAFPVTRYTRNDWRVLAIGVEPHNEASRAALSRDGYYEYRVAN